MISIKFFCNFIEIKHRHGYSPVNLLQNFRTRFPKNTSRELLLDRPYTNPYFWLKITPVTVSKQKCQVQFQVFPLQELHFIYLNLLSFRPWNNSTILRTCSNNSFACSFLSLKHLFQNTI